MRKLKYTLSLFVFFALLANAKSHKNIIYILADDLGYGDLSILGQSHFETPHIDELARKGMIFTDHYSGSTVCAPIQGLTAHRSAYWPRPSSWELRVAT
jgi:membrane-anchored protein YejM (alkaline phosphatase superfamily)